MKISIIIKVLNYQAIKDSLHVLYSQSIHKNLEVIIIKECFDDITDLVNLYEEKFDNICLKSSSNDAKIFNDILKEANGEYLLFSTSNILFAQDTYEDENFLENLYLKASENSCDVVLFNKIDYHKYESISNDYKFIDSIVEKPFKYNDINEDDLIKLSKLDCDVLYSNNFKVNATRFTQNNIENPEIFILENMVNSNKILISDDYSHFRKMYENLETDENKDIKEIDLSEYFNKAIELDIKKQEDIKEILEQDFNPKISIITPVYNALPNDIIKAINSVFNQTFGFNNLELIFINDISSFTDGIELIKKFSAIYPNIHYYEMTEHGGPGFTRNVGLENASSDYIMFLDHDDYYTPYACEILYDTITSEDADIVSGNYIHVNNSYKSADWKKRGLIQKKTILETINEKNKVLDLPPSIWTKIYKKSFLERNNIKMTGFDVATDTIFHYETILNDSKVVYVNENIVMYEQRENDSVSQSVTSKFNLEKLLTLLETRYYIYDLCQKFAPETSITILDNMNYITNVILPKTQLTEDEFKEVAEYSKKLYCDYLNDSNVHKTDDVKKFAQSISKNNYENAYTEYKNFQKNYFFNKIS